MPKYINNVELKRHVVVVLTPKTISWANSWEANDLKSQIVSYTFLQITKTVSPPYFCHTSPIFSHTFDEEFLNVVLAPFTRLIISSSTVLLKQELTKLESLRFVQIRLFSGVFTSIKLPQHLFKSMSNLITLLQTYIAWMLQTCTVGFV